MGPSETKKRLRGGRCPGGEQVLRLRARDGVFRAPARVTFFCCQKKVTKENHSNLRFKDPLARGGQVQIWRYALAHEVQWVTLSVQGSLVPLAPLPLTLCEGRIGCAGGVGDYQIAPIAARSTAMGRWRLTPPGYGGTCLPVGRSVRGSDRPPACHSIPRTPQGEGLRGASFNGAKPSRGRLWGMAVGAKNACRG